MFKVPCYSQTVILWFPLQTNQGLVKQETSDPKTVSTFTDRFVLCVLCCIISDDGYKSMLLSPVNHTCMSSYCSVYMKATKNHVITNVAGGKTICLKKNNFQDTGNPSVPVIWGFPVSCYHNASVAIYYGLFLCVLY